MATKFQQWVNAFDSTTVEAGCSVSISADGYIVSQIASASDTGDTATENITSNLPAGEEGRVRFYLTVPSPWNPTANVTIFHNEAAASSGEVVELYFNAQKVLNVFSRAGRLSSAGLNGGCGPAFADGSEHLIEVSWKKNAFLRVWVDGQLMYNATLTGAASSAVPTAIKVGIDHYDGADGNPMTMRYRFFQYGDVATDILTDPSGTLPAELIRVLNTQVGANMWQLSSLDSAATATAVDGKQLEELVRVAKVNGYECRFNGVSLVFSPKR